MADVIAACAAGAGPDIATCAVELSLNDGRAPEWVQLMPAGAFEARDGRRWRLDDAEAVIAASRRRAGATSMVFDYEHQTDYAPENGQPAPAAGWIQDLEVRDGEIWARVNWTARAKRMIEAGEYRYSSPTFAHTKAGRVLSIWRAALTNDPGLDLPAIARRRRGESMHEQLKRILEKLGLAEDSQPTAAEADAALARIDPAPPIDPAAVAAALGLQATATADEVLAAAKARPTPSASEYVPRSEYNRLATRLTTLETATADEKATAAVDAAIEAGKIAPAQRDWALATAKRDLADFADYVKTAPVIAGGAAPPSTDDGDGALTADEIAVCRNLGLTQDAFKAERKRLAARQRGAA